MTKCIPFAFLCGLAALAPAPPFNAAKLTEDSEVILVGKVKDVGDGGTVVHGIGGREIQLDRRLGRIGVTRVIKGAVPAGETLLVEFFDSKEIQLPYVGLVPERTFLLFLRRTAEKGIYSLASLYHGVQVGSVTCALSGAPETPLERVEWEFVQVVANGTALEARIALDRLSTMKGLVFMSMAPELSKRREEPEVQEAIRGVSLAARIRAGDVNACRELRTLPSAWAAGNSIQGWQQEVLRALSAIGGPDVKAVLNDLLSHESAPVRRHAAMNLRNSADTSAIPFLIKGLEDVDREVGYSCLIALCRITGRPGPGHEEYFERRKEFAEDWKDWWNSRSTIPESPGKKGK